MHNNNNINNNQEYPALVSPSSNSSSSGSSFMLIWYYWYRKYMCRRNRRCNFSVDIVQLKSKYRMQYVQATNTNNLKKKLQQIKQKGKVPQAHSTLSANTTSTSTTPVLIYTINPQSQAKQIEQMLQAEYQGSETSGYGYGGLDKQEIKDMIDQLRCYYLNCMTVFVIYRWEKDRERDMPNTPTLHKQKDLKQQKDNLSLNLKPDLSPRPPPHTRKTNVYQPSLLTSRINLILHSDDSQGMDRNDSMVEGYDKMEDKIQNLEILDKFVELDGLDIWNARYYGIPHCFVKVKKGGWSRMFEGVLGNNIGSVGASTSTASQNPLTTISLHPCHPKTISPTLPILPRLQKHRPSLDKLKPFISYMQTLWQKAPHLNLSPTRQSIFEYNRLPYIFSQDSREKEDEIGVLCYYVVYGDGEGLLTEAFVGKWMEANSSTVLAKTIRYMREKSRNRINNSNIGSNNSKDVVVKGLFQPSDAIW